MKPTEVFGVIVRTLGLLIIFEVLWRVLDYVEVMLVPPFPSGPEGGAGMVAFLLAQALALLAGCVCFFAADTVVRWSYSASLPNGD